MLPIHLDLGFTQIYFYEGIYFLISIVLGIWWAKVRVEKYGGKVEKFEGLVVWSIVGALIGARLSHYVFWQSDVFFENPGVIFSPTERETASPEVWSGDVRRLLLCETQQHELLGILFSGFAGSVIRTGCW